MKWSRMELLQAKDATIEFDEMIRFEPEVFSKMHQIRGLQDVTVSGNVHYEASSERVFADLDIEGVMIVPCSITLEDVEYDFQGDVVELLPVIFQLIVMEVPLKIVKEGLTQYPKGDGWEVVKEEDYIKEKSKEIDPRLAKLKEFKLED